MSAWHNRIVGEGVQPASQFVANPRNWRTHPPAQRAAVTASLNDLGWIQRVIVNRRTGHLIDGHERVMNALAHGDQSVPFLEVDLTEAEEALALAVIDPLAALATTDAAKLDELLRDCQTGEAALQEMLAAMAKEAAAALPGATEDEEPIAPAATIPAVHDVVVVCASAAEQQRVYERLCAEGLTCRLLTVSV